MALRPSPLLVAALLVAVLVPAPSTDAKAAPHDLLDIELDDVVLPEGSSWIVDRPSAPLALKTPGGSTAAERVSVPIAGINTFGFEATVVDGTLHVLVDGKVVRTLGPGTHVVDVPLSYGAVSIDWEFIPRTLQGALDLVLRGARALLPPTLLYPPTLVGSGCLGAGFVLDVRFAEYLHPDRLKLLVDGQEVPLRFAAVSHDWSRLSQILVSTPRLPEGTVSKVDLVVGDTTGREWTLLDDHKVVHRDDVIIKAGPTGPVYDIRPQIHADLPCVGKDKSQVRFFVDGNDRTDSLSYHEGVWLFGSGGDLRYRELRQWRFEVILPDGHVVVKEGTIEGRLDVMEWDAPRVALVWADAPRVLNSEPMKDHFNRAMLADLADDGQMVPVIGKAPSWRQHGVQQVIRPDGATIRAVYSPEALVCGQPGEGCDPFGRSVWMDPSVATLTIRGRDGKAIVLEIAGQFAAAGRIGAGH